MLRIIGTYDKTPWFYPDKENVNGVISADWHMSDKYAPKPHPCMTKEGQQIIPSPFQKEVKRQLIEKLKEIGKVDLLILDGDLCEGKQMKTNGVPVNDSDTDTQVNWAFQLFEETFWEINKPDKVLVTLGSPYHVAVGIGGNLDYQVAEKIDRLTETYIGNPTLRFYLGKDKLYWDVRHGVSIAPVNRLMPYAKTIRTFIREVAEQGGEVPDVIGRAHNHGLAFEPRNFSGGKNAFYAWQSPCLKGSDAYGEMLRYPSSPRLGVLSFSQCHGNLFGGYHCIDVGYDYDAELIQ